LFLSLTYSPPGRCTAREYLDSEDFAGLLSRMFDGAMASIQRIEHKPPPDVLGDYSATACSPCAAAHTRTASRGSIGREHFGHQAEDAVELVGGVGAQVCENHVGCPGGHE
jgi:hypothetical protein